MLFIKRKWKGMILMGVPKFLAIAMSAIVLLSAGLPEELGSPRSSYGLGSARYLDGRNLLYSLFVDTTESSWGEAEKEETLLKLNIAAAYIEKNAMQYGREVEVVCDWQKNAGLTGDAEVDFAINDKADFEDRLKEETALWVGEKVNFDTLMEEYQAEGIALLIFVNNYFGSYALVFDGTDSPNESVILYGGETPAAYAHEILHVFGAHDLYKDAEFTKEVADYVKKNYPLEIMYTVTDGRGNKYYDSIVNIVSPITAYHLGWIDHTEEIDLFPQLIRKK